MQEAGVQVGREQYPIWKGSAQRLGQDELVVHVATDHPDGFHFGFVLLRAGRIRDLLDDATYVVALVAALGPFDLQVLALAGWLVASPHEPHLLRRAVEAGSIQTAQVRIEFHFDVLASAAVPRLAMERLLKGSGIEGVPFTEQHDASALVVGEAARTQFRHQQIDKHVIGGDRPNEKRHLLHRQNALSCIAPALQRAANAT